MADGAAAQKPAVLIIGGLGYLGRFLALHIHRNNLASEVRLVDKQLPELAGLPDEFKEACSRDKFVQADASREQFLSKVFNRPEPHASSQYDYVFNCGGETRYSQDDEVYRVRSHALSIALAQECARRRIPVFVECSTGQVYKPESAPRKESDKTKPWSKLAKWKLAAEEELAKIDGLNAVVLRFANVYGEYTKGFLATALCMARVNQAEKRDMKWLWDAGLRTNTVHVVDAARALWTAAEWRRKKGPGKIEIFNIVDHGNTSQGTLADLIHKKFGITTGFQGTVISTFARLHLDSVVDDVNDETLDPWAALQEQAGLKAGPISPFVEKELLKDTDLSLDGSKFEKETGFTYEIEQLDEKRVDEVLESFKRMGWWP